MIKELFSDITFRIGRKDITSDFGCLRAVGFNS